MEWNLETLEKYYCDICKKQCVSRVPYELHVLSRGHRIKAGNAEINPKVANIEESGLCSSSKLVETNSFSNTGAIFTTDEVDNINKHKSPELYSTMNLPLSSNHEVKDRKYNNNDEQLFFVESTHHKKKPNSEFNTIESSETHLKCYKRCVACAIRSLMGLYSPYEQHFQGKAHKKTIEEKFMKIVGIDSLLLATDSTLQNSVECNSGDVKKYCCEICEKQCTGPMQYEAHILSIAHLRNLRNSKIM
ncbi:hypothetical protein TNIN_242491 [Trichonephila inaurata madagascariensis]|uniref:C2H2-type domain-containing protein n=1 Tax=Trichonephila inaurata madagascariensis TaxID=2747483 RepID=A0A8X6X8H9_9ARAC|nr:hypothetical protein TNIN_242491 [Trichonephila inaurata madagascariensis]